MTFDYEFKLPSDEPDRSLADELALYASAIPSLDFNGVLNYGKPVGEVKTVYPTKIVAKKADYNISIPPFISLIESIIDMNMEEEEMPYPEKIIRNPKKHATTVKWSDGTYTTVRCSADDADDPYFAFCSALAKKVYGSNSKVQRFVKTKTEELKPKAKKKNKE